MRTLRLHVAALALAATAFSVPASAAPVTFGNLTPLAGDGDVLTTGTLDRAINFGGTDQTVNGVPFSAGNVGGSKDTVEFLGNTTIAASAESVVVLNNSPTFAGEGEPFNSFSASYKGLLASAAYNNTTRGTLTLTLGGLKKGTAYTIQFFINDSRDFHGGGRIETVSSGGKTSDSIALNGDGKPGSVGNHLTATFTADGQTQEFVLTPERPGVDDAQINARQLRVTLAARSGK